ncbi:MAG: hypothetical protein ACRDZM_02755 [Acidimicrobiia bacterium]
MAFKGASVNQPASARRGTLVFSNWITGERVGVELVFGGILIMAGVYIGALRPQARRTEAPG